MAFNEVVIDEYKEGSSMKGNLASVFYSVASVFQTKMGYDAKKATSVWKMG